MNPLLPIGLMVAAVLVLVECKGELELSFALLQGVHADSRLQLYPAFQARVRVLDHTGVAAPSAARLRDVRAAPGAPFAVPGGLDVALARRTAD